MGPAGITPDMELIGSLADHGNVDIWFFVPKYVNELGETPRILEKLHRSKFIAVGGGESPVSSLSQLVFRVACERVSNGRAEILFQVRSAQRLPLKSTRLYAFST